jgi:hypothetical protein
MTIAAQAGAGICAATTALCGTLDAVGVEPTLTTAAEAVTDAAEPAATLIAFAAGAGIAFAGPLTGMSPGSDSGYEPTCSGMTSNVAGFGSLDSRHIDIDFESRPGA